MQNGTLHGVGIPEYLEELMNVFFLEFIMYISQLHVAVLITDVIQVTF